MPCSKSSCWQLNYYGQGWYFDPGYNDPDGATIFQSTGSSNGGSYSSPTADALISKLSSGGYPALYKYEDYLATQLPVLWMPQLDNQISAVSNKLKGVYPQDPDGNISLRMAFLHAGNRGHDLTGRAVATLKAVLVDERILHRMQRSIGTSEAFDCFDALTLRCRCKGETRQHSFAINMHRAGAALALITALL